MIIIKDNLFKPILKQLFVIFLHEAWSPNNTVTVWGSFHKDPVNTLL